METATKGRLILAAACIAYTYYSIWILGTPFIETDQPVLNLFPDPYYGLAPPLFAGVLLIGATLITLGGLLIHGELAKRGEPKPKSN